MHNRRVCSLHRSSSGDHRDMWSRSQCLALEVPRCFGCRQRHRNLSSVSYSVHLVESRSHTAFGAIFHTSSHEAERRASAKTFSRRISISQNSLILPDSGVGTLPDSKLARVDFPESKDKKGPDLRNASFVLPLARQIGFLVCRHGIFYEGTSIVDTHSVTSTTFLCSISTTIHATLSVRRRKRASINDSISTKAFYSIPSALRGRKIPGYVMTECR